MTDELTIESNPVNRTGKELIEVRLVVGVSSKILLRHFTLLLTKVEITQTTISNRQQRDLRAAARSNF